MFIVSFILTDDFPMGKVDKSTLSHQTLMELFFENVTGNRWMIVGHGETRKDRINDWFNTDVNSDGEVMTMFWSSCELSGSLALEWLPNTLQKVFLCGNSFSGEINVTCLPDFLEEITFSDNNLSGCIDLTRLPMSLKRLNLDLNSFEGEIDFSNLPPSLQFLDMEGNMKLSGEIREFAGKELGIRETRIKDSRVNE
mmetsp:Transcript_7233/g.10910  ORF Transcript_7233/g.10910 Transcript_7233/m.10910 type:complete len:197 (-) Transcript_7233:24-614(-)